MRKHFNVFCFCAGLGGGAKGFTKAVSRVGKMEARWRSIGAIDVDPAAARDYQRLVGSPCTVMDLFTRDQFAAFHGHQPPAGWMEATPDDIQRAAGNQHPHCVFISSPCKGASGLLSEAMSLTPKYQALNELTLRCVWLMCEAWRDDPVELIVFENVPRLATRGRHLLDQISQILQHYGYAVAETTHDCGELGGLAQSRKRFLLVARHMEKVPPFLYEPEKKRLQSVGSLLDRMQLPGDPAAGPMHRIPALQWKTWVRLAFVEAGKDWRSLNRLAVEDGALRDYLIVPDYHGGYLGVREWGEHCGTVPGNSLPTNGAFSVADPRAPAGAGQYQQYGVLDWIGTAGTVIGVKSPGQGTFSVADPRHSGPAKHSNCFRVVAYDVHTGVVTSGGHPSSGGQAVADPRRVGPTFGKYGVADWLGHANTVISGSTTGQGAFAVADPRSGMDRTKGDHYLTGGHYGVVPWDQSCGAVSASACHDNGRWSVADPRMPSAAQKLVCIIRALDGTWHRPFTTLELAALQSLYDPDEHWSADPQTRREIEARDAAVFMLDGESDQAWRERIGNAVPPKAAQAIAEVMGTTLLLAGAGETFRLSATPVWVRPVAVALSVAQASA